MTAKCQYCNRPYEDMYDIGKHLEECHRRFHVRTN